MFVACETRREVYNSTVEVLLLDAPVFAAARNDNLGGVMAFSLLSVRPSNRLLLTFETAMF